MKRGFICGLLLWSLPMVLSAAGPGPSVTSSEPFQLRGVVVPVAGIPSWPLLPGDEIATGRAPATIRFADGSTVMLQKNSTARIERSDGRVVLRLVNGFVDVNPSATSNVRFNSQVLVANATVRVAMASPLRFNPWRPPPNSPPH